MGVSLRTGLGGYEKATQTMTPREQWNARQRIREMLAELQTMPPHDGLQVTIAAMMDALQTDLTDAHWDTLQRRFKGHKLILAGER